VLQPVGARTIHEVKIAAKAILVVVESDDENAAATAGLEVGDLIGRSTASRSATPGFRRCWTTPIRERNSNWKFFAAANFCSSGRQRNSTINGHKIHAVNATPRPISAFVAVMRATVGSLQNERACARRRIARRIGFHVSGNESRRLTPADYIEAARDHAHRFQRTSGGRSRNRNGAKSE
jgi:hypothetical protein